MQIIRAQIQKIDLSKNETARRRALFEIYVKRN